MTKSRKAAKSRVATRRLIWRGVTLRVSHRRDLSTITLIDGATTTTSDGLN